MAKCPGLIFLMVLLTGLFGAARANAQALTVPANDIQTLQPSSALVTVTGLLRERGTKKPLAGVNVYCFSPFDAPTPIKAITDKKGEFTLPVAPGRVRWRVSLANYEVLEEIEDLAVGQLANSKKFYLEKQSYLVYETTVFGKNEKRDDKTATLTQEQFLTMPGANGDPVKAVQNLPGVNRGNAFSSQVIIEGSSPQDTKYSIDTQNVPIIFHFGGLTSVVAPEAVDRVDYLSSGFGPEFGQTTAGLINLYTRDPQTDRWHGRGYFDIFNLGVLVDGPLNDHSSLLVGFRKSYVGLVLGAVAKGQSSFNLTVAPDFNDMIVEYKNKVDERNDFKLVTIGSIDTLQFVLTEPADQDPSIRGSFSQNTTFFRFIPEWTHKFNSGTIGRAWLGIGQDAQRQNFGTFYFNNVGPVVSARAEIEEQKTESWKSYLGIDNTLSWPQIDFQIPFSTAGQSGGGLAIGSSTLQTVSHSYFLENTAFYWRNVLHSSSSAWTYMPGLRLDYFSLTNEYIPEPRMGLRYAMSDTLTLRGATGLYSAPAPTQDFDSTFGNPNLRSQSAVHATLGFEKDLKTNGNPDGWNISSDLFYKYLYNLVQTTSALDSNGRPQYYNNNGLGRAYGLEVLAKYQSHTWSGWIAYTLSKSTRTYSPAEEQIFQYDQTHNLTLVADREFGKNWKFSGRFRYTTGNPFTPDTGGTLDTDNDIYIATSGGAYSARYEPFYQLDVRFDKKWIYEQWILTGYLDIENVTNHKNVQSVIYSYNYQQQSTITGLPLLPTFGLKGEF